MYFLEEYPDFLPKIQASDPYFYMRIRIQNTGKSVSRTHAD